MQKITPFLWFNDNAEEAVKFYTSVFKDSKIKQITRYTNDGANASGRPEGTIMTISFEIEGMEYMALNGGPIFTFTQAISFVVNCKSQKKVDYLWEKLSEGGETQQCGWLVDKFGISWQIVPLVLGELLQDKDAEKSKRVISALMQMEKIEIKTLKNAYEKG